MAMGLFLYKLVTCLIEPFIGLLLGFRVAREKEDASRRGERLAKNLMPRPDGNLLWIHSASVGESIVALEVIKRVKEEVADDIVVLHTSQTVTSAKIIEDRKLPDTIHQMAPIDTPSIAERFVSHWKPKLLVLVEGEVWPNLLLTARKSGSRSVLINGRMTEKSLRGWGKWRDMARNLFGGLDDIICADEATALGLERLSGKKIHRVHNLKSSLPPLDVDENALKGIRQSFVGSRKCLVATSTHPGDEELILEVYNLLTPRPALIIAPRHPERGTQISKLAQKFGFATQRYSIDKILSQSTEVLVADTLGDLGLWYRLGNAIFLGGASQQGIGGHNPFEPIRLGKKVITGSHGYNFQEDFNQLSKIGAVTIVDDHGSLLQAVDSQLRNGTGGFDEQAILKYLEQAEQPLKLTVATITKHLFRGLSG